MRRRDLITLLGGAAIAWPDAAMAQQVTRMRRVGILESFAVDNETARRDITAFREGLRAAGWMEGGNLRIDIRYADGVVDRLPRLASDLVNLAPDVILAVTPPSVAAPKQRTSSIPIVFVRTTDPVGERLVSSLSKPGGNITGFANGSDLSFIAKKFQLLKEIAPHIRRVALVYSPLNTPQLIGSSQPIESAARSLGLRDTPFTLQSVDDIKRIGRLAGKPQAGLIVLPNYFATLHRDAVLREAGRYQLPAIYYDSTFVSGGGLMSYGPDSIEQVRRAASYVDRILRGETPADLPVQQPTKYDLSINLKTAKALGLTVPQSLLIQADEVIR